MAEPLAFQLARPTAATQQSAGPSVFLSYAHADAPLAFSLRDALKRHRIEVIVDATHIPVAGSIAKFARDSVRDSNATVCIISTNSLISTWVFFEAIATLQKEYLGSGRLICCAIDQRYLDPVFRFEVIAQLKLAVGQYDRLLQDCIADRLEACEVSAERSRLIRLINGLGGLLQRLRETYTLPLTVDSLEETAAKVADHILGIKRDARGIRARAAELRSLFGDDQLAEAAIRTLDYAKDFSNRGEHHSRAVALKRTLRLIGERQAAGLAADDAEKEREAAIVQFMGLIDEIEETARFSFAS